MRHLLAFAAMLVLLFWWVRQGGPRGESEALAPEDLALPSQPVSQSPEPPTTAPAPSALSATPTQRMAPPPPPGAEPEENPYYADPLKKRKLDLPKPKSIADLLGKITPHQIPMLPQTLPNQPPLSDGDVTTWFPGYYELADGSLKRIRVQRSAGDRVTVQIEEANGAYKEWSTEKRQIQLANFDGDPYSLVIKLPDQRILYLKFASETPIGDLRHGLRTMSGWLIAKDEKKSLRAAVVDMYLVEHQNQTQVEVTDWPAAETIRSLLPPPLP